MYFWAEKYIGSGLDQTTGSGSSTQRRSSGGQGSRSGSASLLEKDPMLSTGGGSAAVATGAGEIGDQRKSLTLTNTAQLHVQQHQQRRESRVKDGGSGGITTIQSQQQQQFEQSARRESFLPLRSASIIPPTQQHRSSTTISQLPQSTTTILLNIFRAVIVRIIFLTHCLACLWVVSESHVEKSNLIWTFALIAFCIVGEGFYAVFVRNGVESKWFSPALFLYLLATLPSIWLLHTSLCKFSTFTAHNDSTPIWPPFGLQLQQQMNNSSAIIQKPIASIFLNNNGIFLSQILSHALFLVIIFSGLFMPRKELSGEELSQILLAYCAIMTDILEFLGLLNYIQICNSPRMLNTVLAVWALSLLQFSLVLTASRSRKMRIAVATKILTAGNQPDLRQAFFDLDIWAILITLTCQDVPFLIVRLWIFRKLDFINFYTMAFIGKNLIIIGLQTYRIFILLNGRYIKPEISVRSLLDEKRQSLALLSNVTINPPATKAETTKQTAYPNIRRKK